MNERAPYIIIWTAYMVVFAIPAIIGLFVLQKFETGRLQEVLRFLFPILLSLALSVIPMTALVIYQYFRNSPPRPMQTLAWVSLGTVITMTCGFVLSLAVLTRGTEPGTIFYVPSNSEPTWFYAITKLFFSAVICGCLAAVLVRLTTKTSKMDRQQ
jgi:hypothetical protein